LGLDWVLNTHALPSFQNYEEDKKKVRRLPIPSKEWLEERNLKIVWDNRGKWHLEPKNPHAPTGKRPPYVPKPIETGASLEDGELISPLYSIPVKRKTRREVKKCENE